MIPVFCQLGSGDLTHLAAALRSGRLAPPFAAATLRRLVPDGLAEPIAAEVRRRVVAGATVEAVAEALDLLRQDRDHRPVAGDSVDLVWTGPEAPGITNRDTSVVVRELFRTARDAVLVAGYAIHQGQVVFRELADRMDSEPNLHVRMFLDIQRPYGDSTAAVDLIRRFVTRFTEQQWPGRRLPEVYHDPRALEPDQTRRASLHAKCVVVDAEQAFVSSANFTEAAQTRNIEVGLLVRNPAVARQLADHFQGLAAAGLLRPVSFP